MNLLVSVETPGWKSEQEVGGIDLFHNLLEF
jgi:hypothetical protein